MLKSISLKCANCGANLDVTPEMDVFACGYCGASQSVERKGGTVSLRLLSDAIKNVQVGTDKTAAELALKRLAQEFENVQREHTRATGENSRQIEFTWKLLCGLLLVGIIVCLFIGSSGGISAYFAVFLGVMGTCGILFLGFRLQSQMQSKFKKIEKELFNKGVSIQDKIAHNRKLVDS